MPNVNRVARMIVKRLPRLEIVEMVCIEDDMPRFMHTLINGLPKLTFLLANCGTLCGTSNELQLRALQTLNTRPFRTDIHDSLDMVASFSFGFEIIH